MTPEQFAEIFPACPEPAIWSASITAAWIKYGFSDIDAQAGYLGICGNETGGFTHVDRENMNYSPQRAMEVFGSSRATPCVGYCDDGDSGKNFASCIYANMIGNGSFPTGDGWAFRGGGIIQLTGRANYTACGDSLGVDLANDPDALTEDPATSAAAAAWFMAIYNPQILPLLSTGSEADFLTAAGMVGYPPPGATETRLAYRAKALEVLGGTPAAPSGPPPSRVLSIGCKGADVADLQRAINDQFLIDEGLRLEVDEDFGSLTLVAVKNYQLEHGLVVDGVAGKATQTALGIWRE
jgi:putative chitinase